MMAFDTLGYVRVSTPQQAGPARSSLREQERAIRETAAHLGRTMGEVFADPGVSGATAAERPAFMSLLATATSSPRDPERPGLILAPNSSRWGRFENPTESPAILFRLRRAGWVVRFVEEDADMIAVEPIAPLSDRVSDAIAARLAAPTGHVSPSVAHFAMVLNGMLASVTDERRAYALLRLSADLDALGIRSALMRVIAGDVDLVGLLEKEVGR